MYVCVCMCMLVCMCMYVCMYMCMYVGVYVCEYSRHQYKVSVSYLSVPFTDCTVFMHY